MLIIIIPYFVLQFFSHLSFFLLLKERIQSPKFELFSTQPYVSASPNHHNSTRKSSRRRRSKRSGGGEVEESEEEEEEEEEERVTSPSSAAAAAAAGGGIQNPAPPPRCQVEGCTADLSSAKDYHRRHKVCEMHSKASKAIAAGREQRFCQQCSRFHVLTEFDEIKRSCRRRLAGHNERRRKPHLESSSSAAAAAVSNLSFNCRISSPMRSTDAFHIHGTAADSLSLDDCKQTQFLEQIQGSQGGGRPLSSPDLHDDDEHSNHHHPFANVLNLSSPWRPGENVRSPQHIQVEEKEGQLIMLDRRYSTPSSNRLLMFLQSPRGQMRGALDPSPDVGLSNLSPLVVGGGGSSQEFVDGAKGSLCQNLSLGGGSGWENNYHHNQGCESQSSGCALSLLSWGTTPCPPALDLCVDNTSLDHHHHHQPVADNNMGSNTVASFATHHLPQQQSQEHYLAFEKLFSAQSGGLGAMGISDIRITDIQQQQQPLEQSQLHGVGGGGGGDDGASVCRCISSIISIRFILLLLLVCIRRCKHPSMEEEESMASLVPHFVLLRAPCSAPNICSRS
ncbi:unnamed protein product [Sphagnum troendelagicum]|uniref:SBP-type domain-containing protein n=1 Tax=Sphagnum troendelagicum TaxID=128251 RepID=A0ABP0TKH2_9BRYO